MSYSSILSWTLIIGVTMVSTTMLMFLAQFFAMLQLSSKYYDVSISSILLFAESFNIFHIFLTPFLFRPMENHLTKFIMGSALMMGLGLVIRTAGYNNYTIALLGSLLVSLSHIPIIAAPYGLLKLFKPEHRGYAASFPLFVPTIGINFSIFYTMTWINEVQGEEAQFRMIERLSWIITMVGVVSMMVTVLLVYMLEDVILHSRREGNKEEK